MKSSKANKPFSTYLPPDLIKRIKVAAERTELNVSTIIKQAAELWLKANNA